MIGAIGVDLIEIARIARLWQRSGDRFLHRVYTAAELAYCLHQHAPAAALAARFCAKEAVAKCLGTGIGDGVTWRSIEVVRDPAGPVSVRLHGRALCVAAQRGLQTFHLSLSHDEQRAIAFAVASRGSEPPLPPPVDASAAIPRA